MGKMTTLPRQTFLGESNTIVSSILALGYREIATGLAIGLLLYGLVLAIYRTCLSPLAKFPGPKLAAATEWYEFYYHLVKDGQFGSEVDRMHREYGPIVRINPWELSVRDPSFYSELYVTGSKRRTNMWPRGREGVGISNTHHMSVGHDLHRHRRKHLESFFSRQGIGRVEDIIASEARLLCNRLQALDGTASVVHIDHAFMALTGDIISHVACGLCPKLMEDTDFSPDWHNLMLRVILVVPLFRCFNWLNSLLHIVPAGLVNHFYPKGTAFRALGMMGMESVQNIREELLRGGSSTKGTKKSVFHHLIASDIPESEKSSSRLQAESLIFLFVGTLTSANTLAMIVFYVLSNPHIEQRLRQYLKEVTACFPEKTPIWTDLEKIPYLQACIKEGLRLNGPTGNMVRCSLDVALQYKQWTIPKKTPVGMSIYHMHMDPEVYPEPMKFIPERWLGDYDPKMNRNFVPSTKGSRACLGMNLATAELNITVALLFRPGGPKMSVFETDESDILSVRDFVLGLPKPDSRGVRVVVH